MDERFEKMFNSISIRKELLEQPLDIIEIINRHLKGNIIDYSVSSQDEVEFAMVLIPSYIEMWIELTHDNYDEVIDEFRQSFVYKILSLEYGQIDFSELIQKLPFTLKYNHDKKEFYTELKNKLYHITIKDNDWETYEYYSVAQTESKAIDEVRKIHHCDFRVSFIKEISRVGEYEIVPIKIEN